MTKPEKDAAELLATRVAGGLNSMTEEQRAHVLGLLALEFCAACGGKAPSVCRCGEARSNDGRL